MRAVVVGICFRTCKYHTANDGGKEQEKLNGIPSAYINCFNPHKLMINEVHFHPP